jgi:hypothetical protein
MPRTYTLFWTTAGDPPGGIRVTAEIPDGWTETLDGMGGPAFTVPGHAQALVGIAAIRASGASDGERIAWAMRQQFDDAAGVTQAVRGDGRVWAVAQASGRVHARMFVAAAHDSVVMASAMASGDAGLLGAVERVLDSVRAVP